MFEVKKGNQEKKDDVNKVRMTQLVVWVCVGVDIHELTFLNYVIFVIYHL